MIYLTFNTIATSFSLIITRDRNAFFNYLTNIETLSIAFPAFKFISAKAVDKFSAVFSASAKSLV
jgi:hypothetical protein